MRRRSERADLCSVVFFPRLSHPSPSCPTPWKPASKKPSGSSATAPRRAAPPTTPSSSSTRSSSRCGNWRRGDRCAREGRAWGRRSPEHSSHAQPRWPGTRHRAGVGRQGEEEAFRVPNAVGGEARGGCGQDERALAPTRRGKRPLGRPRPARTRTKTTCMASRVARAHPGGRGEDAGREAARGRSTLPGRSGASARALLPLSQPSLHSL